MGCLFLTQLGEATDAIHEDYVEGVYRAMFVSKMAGEFYSGRNLFGCRLMNNSLCIRHPIMIFGGYCSASARCVDWIPAFRKIRDRAR